MTRLSIIGAAIRRERTSRNLSQAYLGKLAGVNQGTISKLERGFTGLSHSCSTDVLLAVIAALGMRLIMSPVSLDEEN